MTHSLENLIYVFCIIVQCSEYSGESGHDLEENFYELYAACNNETGPHSHDFAHVGKEDIEFVLDSLIEESKDYNPNHTNFELLDENYQDVIGSYSHSDTHERLGGSIGNDAAENNNTEDSNKFTSVSLARASQPYTLNEFDSLFSSQAKPTPGSQHTSVGHTMGCTSSTKENPDHDGVTSHQTIHASSESPSDFALRFNLKRSGSHYDKSTTQCPAAKIFRQNDNCLSQPEKLTDQQSQNHDCFSADSSLQIASSIETDLANHSRAQGCETYGNLRSFYTFEDLYKQTKICPLVSPNDRISLPIKIDGFVLQNSRITDIEEMIVKFSECIKNTSKPDIKKELGKYQNIKIIDYGNCKKEISEKTNNFHASAEKVVGKDDEIDKSKKEFLKAYNSSYETIKNATSYEDKHKEFVMFIAETILENNGTGYRLNAEYWNLQILMAEIYFYLIWRVRQNEERTYSDNGRRKYTIISEMKCIYELMLIFYDHAGKGKTDWKSDACKGTVREYRLLILSFLKSDQCIKSIQHYLYDYSLIRRFRKKNSPDDNYNKTLYCMLAFTISSEMILHDFDEIVKGQGTRLSHKRKINIRNIGSSTRTKHSWTCSMDEESSRNIITFKRIYHNQSLALSSSAHITTHQENTEAHNISKKARKKLEKPSLHTFRKRLHETPTYSTEIINTFEAIIAFLYASKPGSKRKILQPRYYVSFRGWTLMITINIDAKMIDNKGAAVLPVIEAHLYTKAMLLYHLYCIILDLLILD